MILKKTYTAFLLSAIFFMLLTIKVFAGPGGNSAYSVFQKKTMDTLPVSDTTYESVEVEAYFDGGEASWRSYLEQNLNPAAPVNNGAPAGLYTVYIQFIVSTDGNISNVKPLTKHGYGMEAEVMRIIRKSPKWVPAIQNGRPVNAYRKQPVTFQVIVEKKKKRGKG